MTGIKFTHANHKRPIYITREQVWNIYYSAAHDCTHLVSTAGAICPVAESVDEAVRLVYGNSVSHEAGPKTEK